MSEDENSKKESKFTNRRLRALFSIVILLSISFAGSFLTTDYLTNPNKKRVENSNDEATSVINQNTNYLKDNLMIVLKENGIEKEYTLEDIKNQNSLTGDITEEKLELALKAKGYILETTTDLKSVFSKDNALTLEGNKFYLGSDGKDSIAIFSTDKSGRIAMVEQDLSKYRVMKISALSEEEQNNIKSFHYKYNSLEEALNGISAYGS